MEKGTCKQGVFVKNIINGMEGFVSGRIMWLYGCEKLVVIPRNLNSNSLIPDRQPRMIVNEEYLEMTGEESPYEREFVTVNTEKWFGKRCRDKVTGIEGVCITCLSTLFSADQYELEWLDEKGKRDSDWFDEGRLEIISEGVDPEDVASSKPGGGNTTLPWTPLPAFAF